MRIRQAQALCPELQVVERDADRDARFFEPVAAAVAEVAPSVEVLRPGLVVVDAAAAGKYYGSEEAAAQRLIDAAALAGVDVMAGVADEVTTAILAARAQAVVPSGASTSFLAPLSVQQLVAEESLGCSGEVVAALQALGVRTLGELAALPLPAVSTRFGREGERCHRLATAATDRTVAPALPTADAAVTFEPPEPLARVDEAAFLARQLAAQLHRRLAEAGVVCQRLKVTAVMNVGGEEERLARVWRTREPLTEQLTADRVRWQLDGWLTSRRAAVEGEDALGNGIVSLVLDPIECTPPEYDRAGLWATGKTHAEGARRVLERVQSTLGIDAVLQPRPAGGRGPLERVDLVPFGEDREPVRAGTWPGAIPGPHPSVRHPSARHPAARLRLLDAAGRDVAVDDEALLTAQPERLYWGRTGYRVTGWAGPWPVDEQWWTPGGKRYARLQVVAENQEGSHAWLLVWGGAWRVEASYE